MADQTVSIEFMERMVKEQKSHAVKMALIPVQIYAKSVADQVATLSDRIIKAQEEQLLTDEQITEKSGIDTEDWSPEDFDRWRLLGAQTRLRFISTDMGDLMQSVVSLLEEIRRKGDVS